MIDIKLIRENPDMVKENIKKKFQDNKLPLVDEVIEFDKKNREAFSKEEFDKLNDEREVLGKPLFANARNAAAGSLRQLDAKITSERPLDIYIFNVQKVENKTWNDLGFISYSCSKEKLTFKKEGF